jgi:NAD(P)-dependent dehydrogenase (short-subunit alcohol dehydrogenase family)
MGALDGKVVVVTGGTRGIGRAIAEAFAGACAQVVVASRTAETVDETVQALTTAGYQAAGMAVDVGDMAQVRALADFAVARFGRLDIWVNNAGIAGPYGPTMGFPPETFLRVVRTNILGVYNGSHTAMRQFLAQRSGKLINLLGHGYKEPLPYQNAYGSSKAWVRSFTKALAEENRGSGVGVFAFNPGMVLTELLTDVDVIAGSEEKLAAFPTILRMWAKPPESVMEKIVWLASGATDGRTGLEVSLHSTGRVLGGAAREGLRKLTKRPAPRMELTLRTVEPVWD